MITGITAISMDMGMDIIKQKKEKGKNQYVRRMLFFKKLPDPRDYENEKD
jgi:hypothetical protein